MRSLNTLNLSILLSVGKETNKHFLSSGERIGNSPHTESANHLLEVCRIVTLISSLLFD